MDLGAWHGNEKTPISACEPCGQTIVLKLPFGGCQGGCTLFIIPLGIAGWKLAESGSEALWDIHEADKGVCNHYHA